MPERPNQYRPNTKRPSPSAAARGTANQRGYNYKWQRFRLAYLAQHPLCVRCTAEGRTVEAEHVDHVDNLGPLGPRGYDDTNLQALCARCHGKKTATEDGGNFGRGKPQ